MNSLDKIINTYEQSTSLNILKKNQDGIDIECFVEKICEGGLMIRSLESNLSIYCTYAYNMDHLETGNKIRIRGKISLEKCRLLINAEQIFSVHEDPLITKADEIKYHKMRYIVSKKKRYDHLIKKNNARPAPPIIKNIGLIVFPNNEKNLTDFKFAFQQKCQSKVFVYKLPGTNFLNSMNRAIAYFNKYHEIDLICILANKINPKIAIDLSSKKAIEIIGKKSGPYISIVTQPAEYNPLSALLANKEHKTLDNFINFVYQSQVKTRTEIREYQNYIKGLINEAIEMKHREVTHLVNLFEDFRPQQPIVTTEQLFAEVKELLLKKIRERLIILLEHVIRNDTMIHSSNNDIMKKLCNIAVTKQSNGISPVEHNEVASSSIIDSNIDITKNILPEIKKEPLDKPEPLIEVPETIESGTEITGEDFTAQKKHPVIDPFDMLWLN